jgi:hypothetical protein
VGVPGVDVGAVIQQQRSATMNALQDYTRLKRRAAGDDPHDLAWGLVLDSLVFTAEAEIRWLDHCEARLRRAAQDRPDAAPRATSLRDGSSLASSEGAPISTGTETEVGR